MEQKLIEAKFKKNNLTKALLITGTLLIIIGFGLSGNVYDYGRTYAGYGYGYDYYRNLFSFARFLIKLFFRHFIMVLRMLSLYGLFTQALYLSCWQVSFGGK